MYSAELATLQGLFDNICLATLLFFLEASRSSDGGHDLCLRETYFLKNFFYATDVISKEGFNIAEL